MAGTEVKTIPVPAGRPVIQSYAADGFRISGTRHAGAVLVFADGVASWSVTTPVALDALAPAIARRADFDLLLIGCADVALDLAPELLARLRAEGVVAEPMGTGAACRTYNLLQAEGRRIAAALLPPAS
jgi:uncharacterized protein